MHGVLLLDKPLGWSSNDALQKVKWLLRAQKAGHTGTLDPLATGVLPLCFGAATKFSQLQLDADKGYEAVVRLGVRTSTGDAEGEILEERAFDMSRCDLANVTRQFTGQIEQVPPMHSALKKDGRPLYEYARAGIEVSREARPVTIHELELAPLGTDAEPTMMRMTVKCSKGTYIRTLAQDIGDVLGCGASLQALRRTQSGGLHVSQCVTLAALEAMAEEERLDLLLPVDSLLGDHVRITLDAANAARFLSGLRRRGAWPDQAQVAVYGPGSGSGPAALLGTGHIKAGELIPQRLLSPPEIEELARFTGNSEEGTP